MSDDAVSREIQAVQPPVTLPTGGQPLWQWVLRVSGLLSIIACVAFFVRYFDHETPQLYVDGLFLVAIILWVTIVASFERGPLLGITVSRADLWPLVLILVTFAAAWLPFYDNWRWAYTGDSFGVFSVGYWYGRNGIRQSLLSVHGIDNAFTYLWELSYSFPMRLFAPTLFWHRIGQLLWAGLALTTIYAYFTLVLRRHWAAAIIAATALNYVWLWFSYVSYLKMDSFVFYFLTLIFATFIWRQPDRLIPWMLAGLTAGLSLFYTPTAWSAVILVGLGLAVFSVVTRRFSHALVYGVSFLLVATPIIIEIPWFMRMTSQQTSPTLQWDYLVRIFRQIALMPYHFEYDKLGVQGAFLRWPLGPLYLAGCAIAAVGFIPQVRRWLRIPGVASALLMLLIWDAVLLTLTNKDYGQPSTKRAYNLIPLQIFFALLPFIVIEAWIGARRRLRQVLAVVVVASIVVYGLRNIALIMFPKPMVYGGNVFDGMVEIRQRFPGRPVLLLTQREVLRTSFAPGELLHLAYGVADTVTIESAFTPESIQRGCDRAMIICYEPNYDRQRMESLVRDSGISLRRFPLMNSFEAVCFECKK